MDKNHMPVGKKMPSEETGAIFRLEQEVAACLQVATARARKLRTLTLEIIEAEERERQRIAGILHGDLRQVH